MNKLNSAALFKTYPYMVALVTEDMDCSTSQCQEAIELLLKSSKEISYKFPLQPVWINSKDNKLLAKKLRVVETECLVYLANNKAVVYYEDWELKSLNIWIKKRMILPSIAYSKHDQLESMNGEHDLVVSYGGLKNQYYKMFRYIASSYTDLTFAHSFSAPVSF